MTTTGPIDGNYKSSNANFNPTLKSKNTENPQKVQSTDIPLVTSKSEVTTSALDATAAQIWGVHLANVDKSEAATAKRMELAFETDPFMTTLAELQGIEPDFTSFAMANIQGVDHDKLNRHMQHPLNPETEAGIGAYMDTMIS